MEEIRLSIEEVSSVSGMSVGEVRVAHELLFGGPLTTPNELTPGETAVLLAYTSLALMGYPRDRILLAIRHFKEPIQNLITAKMKSHGALIIQDGRWAVLEGYDLVFDMTESKAVQLGSIPTLPMVFAGVVVRALYSQTVETIVRRRSAKATLQSE